MAKRPANKEAAQETVFENLGLSAADLGASDLSEGSGNEDEGNDDGGENDDDGDESEQVSRQGSDDNDNDGDGDESDPSQRQNDLSRDEQRVTHTQQRKSPAKPLPRNAEVRPDARGNLIGRDGQIVARAGKEARLYKEAHQAKQAVQQHVVAGQRLSTNLNRAVEIGQELQRRLEIAEAQNDAVSKVGLPPTELLEAASLFAEAKANPISVLKKLLTRAAANGIDLTQIGITANGGVDPKSFMEMIRNEIGTQMKPLQERSAQEQRRAEQEQEQSQTLRQTEQHVQEFFTTNQEALEYLPIFKAVMTNPQFRNMPLQEIWLRIQLNLRNRQSNGNGRVENRRQPSLPNGRGGNFIPKSDSQLAAPSSSYESILSEVLDQHYPSQRR